MIPCCEQTHADFEVGLSLGQQQGVYNGWSDVDGSSQLCLCHTCMIDVMFYFLILPILSGLLHRLSGNHINVLFSKRSEPYIDYLAKHYKSVLLLYDCIPIHATVISLRTMHTNNEAESFLCFRLPDVPWYFWTWCTVWSSWNLIANWRLNRRPLWDLAKLITIKEIYPRVICLSPRLSSCFTICVYSTSCIDARLLNAILYGGL